MFESTNFEIEKDRNTILIKRQWFRVEHILIALVALAWNGFMFFWIFMFFKSNAETKIIVFMTVAATMHILIGWFMAYYSLCAFFNKTYIRLTKHKLSIKHEPLPSWQKNIDIDVSKIKYFWVKSGISKNIEQSSSQKPVYYLYNLWCMDTNQKTYKLISYIHTKKSPEPLEKIKQEMEQFLACHKTQKLD
ncbi:MAG: hypothetical protein JJT94_14785 [Bernardetiaceae bacterium]|nr:hypothetical protein [Bernardetiaceae bacterium]